MLFKLLFTAIAVLWLVQALRPYFAIKPPPPPSPPSPPPPKSKSRDDDYIDYEEIKP
ncbi:MAG: hypothetical protein IT260_00560 [Saprospiraceae bacterium]|nr:hypothetical protein [Saprospiraceae bacterium]